MNARTIRKAGRPVSRRAVRIASPSGHVSEKLEGRLDASKGGHGVFAREPIRAREVLVVWGGDVVTESQLQVLPEAQRHRLTLQVEENLFLLTTREGAADWVNHSCEPNAGIDGQLVLVAMRDIAKGEEICFDYAMTDSYPYDEFDCRCGAKTCRGRVSANDWRILELQERYRGFFSSHIERLIRRAGERSAS
jgi:hypothetical protein